MRATYWGMCLKSMKFRIKDLILDIITEINVIKYNKQCVFHWVVTLYMFRKTKNTTSGGESILSLKTLYWSSCGKKGYVWFLFILQNTAWYLVSHKDSKVFYFFKNWTALRVLVLHRIMSVHPLKIYMSNTWEPLNMLNYMVRVTSE